MPLPKKKTLVTLDISLKKKETLTFRIPPFLHLVHEQKLLGSPSGLHWRHSALWASGLFAPLRKASLKNHNVLMAFAQAPPYVPWTLDDFSGESESEGLSHHVLPLLKYWKSLVFWILFWRNLENSEFRTLFPSVGKVMTLRGSWDLARGVRSCPGSLTCRACSQRLLSCRPAVYIQELGLIKWALTLCGHWEKWTETDRKSSPCVQHPCRPLQNQQRFFICLLQPIQLYTFFQSPTNK